MRGIRASAGCLLAFLVLLRAAAPLAQSRGSASDPAAWAPVPDSPAPGAVEIVPVQGNVYMLVGAGANITVQAGADGVLIVDAGLASMSGPLIAALNSISSGPLRYIVDTTEGLEHTGGNAAIASTGEIIPLREEGYALGPQGALDYARASVISHLNVFNRMVNPVAGRSPRDADAWPDNTYSTPYKRLYFNDEPVVITHLPSTTDGNSIVLFRKSDVVSVGDLLDLSGYPRIDAAAGGDLEAVIDALNYVISVVVVPRANSAGGTMVVPSHGHVADHAELVYYRDMLTIVRDRVRHLIDKGLTLEQVQAARPTRGYDALYGSASGPWTTAMFIDAAYRSLAK